MHQVCQSERHSVVGHVYSAALSLASDSTRELETNVLLEIQYNTLFTMATSEDEYEYSDQGSDYPVSDDEEMDWSNSGDNPNAAPMMLAATGEFWNHACRPEYCLYVTVMGISHVVCIVVLGHNQQAPSQASA